MTRLSNFNVRTSRQKEWLNTTVKAIRQRTPCKVKKPSLPKQSACVVIRTLLVANIQDIAFSGGC